MNPDKLETVATQFGVARVQVERDHLISHVLGYLSTHFADRVVFIGGTALARTHLVDGRLSEDIDLIAVGPRFEVARDLYRALPRAVMRSHGRTVWDSAISEVVGDPGRTVADIALSWCFDHTGCCAGSYRKKFGGMPSEERRR